MTALVATAPGPLSTVQDSGRWGHLRSGVSPAGAMDMIALAAANLIVGNPPGEAAIEFTLVGGEFELDGPSARLAVAGDAEVTLAGAPIGPWRSFVLRHGERLRIGALRRGARGYLAVAGGLATPLQMGSRSTHARSGLGGGPLRAGDSIPLARQAAAEGAETALDPAALPYLPLPVRVVLGPQEDRFTAAGIAAFLGGEYVVTPDADRMGYRLDGPPIAATRGHNIVSDGIANGQIQIPGAGSPLVLLADRGTTGGYPKIAGIVTADLGRFAQTPPGRPLRFAAVDVDQARQLAIAWRTALDGLAARVVPVTGPLPTSEALLAANLAGGAVNALDTDTWSHS